MERKSNGSFPSKSCLFSWWCVFEYFGDARKVKKLFKAQKIVDSILDDYSKNSIIQLNSNDLIKSKYELIISRCELLKKLPPTYENYIMIYNGLLNYSKKNDNKIHKLGSILDVE